MLEILSRLHGDDIVGLVAVVGGFITAITVVCVVAWERHRERQLAVTIIEDMLDQGMSVEQIERILKAAGFGGSKTRLHSLRGRVQAVRDEV